MRCEALNRLGTQDSEQLKGALGFLTFYYAADLTEGNESKLDDEDLPAKVMLRLFRFAQGQGEHMTLRMYVDMAELVGKVKPELKSAYDSQK